MSSLGDLLLAHLKPNKSSESPPPQNDQTTTVDKVFTEDRVEKGDEEVVEETRSNASSTDDYVRELLDPDDRPRNVWHVVEGPKSQPDDETSQHQLRQEDQEGDQAREEDEKYDEEQQDWEAVEIERSVKSRSSEYREDKVSMQDTENNNQSHQTGGGEGERVEDEATVEMMEGVTTSRDDAGSSTSKRDNTLEDYELGEEKHDDNDRKSGKTDERRRSSGHHRDRSRERSSRRHRHHDRDRGSRDYDHDKDRDDRHKSRRKHDYSDDDDDDQYDSRRRSGNRDHRRSHSRSKTSSSRRRERSRSESQSPVTKRNSRTILIMQLNPRVHSRDLEEFFSDIGKVREVRLIMDSKTRRHKGIAYIEFEDASSAAKAFALNGQKFFGAPIVIQSAQMEKNRPSSDWHSSSSTSQTTNSHPTTSHQSSRPQLPPNSYRVYVGGLNVNLTEEMIRSVFEPFGPIVRFELMRDRVTNVSRGYAFITYAHIEDGQNAVQSLDGFELAGKSLRVSKSTDKSERYPTNTESNPGMGGRGGHHNNDGADSADGRLSRSKDCTASLYELAG